MEVEMGAEAAAAEVVVEWTDERHVSFLNWIEASFVRRLMETDQRRRLQRQPRLDRFIPDSAESTHDGRIREVMEMKAERRRSPRRGRSQDQVVPELVSREHEKNDRGDDHGAKLVIRG